MAYLVGYNTLFESTLFSTNEFKEKFASSTSEKVFLAIQNAIDTILYAEEDIIKLNNKLQEIDDRNKKTDNIIKKIDKNKEKIALTFLRTQNLIISSYFDAEFNKIFNLDKLENYRNKLTKFKDYIGTAEGYTFYNDYYINKMEDLEEKYNILENGGLETAIYKIESKENKFLKFLHTIKNFFLKKTKITQYNYKKG